MSYTQMLRSIINSLQSPVIILLLTMIALTILLLGTLAAELFIERIHLKVNGRRLPNMVEAIHKYPGAINDTINGSDLLKRQKELLREIISHPDLTPSERESLAVRLVERQQAIYDRRVKVTDLIAKTSPMLGLMGTLIPLGPGIIALGQGDTMTLSNSLLVAFDTTVSGLVCAFLALIISAVRKTWYRNYMSILEMLVECILEETGKEMTGD